MVNRLEAIATEDKKKAVALDENVDKWKNTKRISAAALWTTLVGVIATGGYFGLKLVTDLVNNYTSAMDGYVGLFK